MPWSYRCPDPIDSTTVHASLETPRIIVRILLIILIAASGLSGAQAHVLTTITPSGLNTTVARNGPVSEITGETRPGQRPRSVPELRGVQYWSGRTSRFSNTTPTLPTSNILSRVTGGNVSQIYGTIDTMTYPAGELVSHEPGREFFSAPAPN